ncbi:MAG: SMP-30/gluconolactonase/LRE family protein [Aquabacterium sp.]|nr:MAG: SMP-30/gluconolactonase/LRE family protein [Aquabacterium sp.]
MRRLLPVLALVFFGLIAWLALAPVPIEPVSWQAPGNTGYTGPHAPNHKLAGLRMIDLGGEEGPEDLVAHDGWIYAGLKSGKVVRVPVDAGPGAKPQAVLDTGGRPLGLAFDAQGRLLIADAMRGLLRATLPAAAAGTARVELLLDRIDDGGPQPDPVRYADAVLVEPDGRIWLTDASRRFGARQWGGTFEASVLDTLEHSCTGRLIVIEPDGRAAVAMRDLCFPNGLALAGDGRHLLLSETTAYRIWKLRTDARGLSAKALADTPRDAADAPARVILDKLPGFPDNLARGENGRTWTGLTKPRSPVIDFAADQPWLRSLTMRLPRSLWPVPRAYGHVIAFDDEGKVLADLQDPDGTYPETTAVTEAGGRLFVQSLHARAIGWMERSKAGL